MLPFLQTLVFLFPIGLYLDGATAARKAFSAGSLLGRLTAHNFHMYVSTLMEARWLDLAGAPSICLGGCRVSPGGSQPASEVPGVTAHRKIE